MTGDTKKSTRHRKTSAEAYKALVEGGLLPKRRKEIYAWLFHRGPATRNEIAMGIGGVPNDTSTRLREMIDQRVVEEIGETKCAVTGNSVILYDVTNVTFPIPYRRTPTKRKKPTKRVGIKACNACPLIGVREDGFEVCSENTEIYTLEEGRPQDCPLVDTDITYFAE